MAVGANMFGVVGGLLSLVQNVTLRAYKAFSRVIFEAPNSYSREAAISWHQPQSLLVNQPSSAGDLRSAGRTQNLTAIHSGSGSKAELGFV